MSWLSPILAGLILAGASSPLVTAQARPLQAILAETLEQDPVLLQARAREREAAEAVRETAAGHLPVVTVIGDQTLARRDDFAYRDRDRRRSNVGVRASLNVFSWGAIDAAVRRDRARREYFDQGHDDIREDLGLTIAQLYLTALRARDQISIYNRSLARHDKIIRDLGTIVRYDTGRRSELTQARARRLQVQSEIALARRNQTLALNRLSRYMQRPLQAKELEDPFALMTVQQLINTYHQADLMQTPAYLSRQAGLRSTQEELKSSQAARLPSLNLEGQIMPDNRHELHLTLSWNIFDQAARHNIGKKTQAIEAARAELDQTLLQLREQAVTAQEDMEQSQQRAELSRQHIATQQQVVTAYEQQFLIARRSLNDVLDGYRELSSIELARSTALNDFRDAAVAYLHSQAAIARWAGLSPEPAGVIQPTVILQQP